MIRNDSEYKEAVRRLKDEKDRLAQQKGKLEEMGLSKEEVKRALDPMRSFHLQLAEEVASYERLKRGEFDEVRNLRGVGQLLIAARISRGMSQRDLARRLEVDESQISRDERNEYHGVSIERAARILETLGVEVISRAEQVEPQEMVET